MSKSQKKSLAKMRKALASEIDQDLIKNKVPVKSKILREVATMNIVPVIKEKLRISNHVKTRNYLLKGQKRHATCDEVTATILTTKKLEDKTCLKINGVFDNVKANCKNDPIVYSIIEKHEVPKGNGTKINTDQKNFKPKRGKYREVESVELQEKNKKESTENLHLSFKNSAVADLSQHHSSKDIIISNLIEQRVCLEFCVFNKVPCANALKMLRKAYGDASISKTRAYEWYKMFMQGRTLIEDLPHSSRPTTSINHENIQKVKELVLKNRSHTVREIAAHLRISIGSVHSILHDVLNMRRVGFTESKKRRKGFPESLT